MTEKLNDRCLCGSQIRLRKEFAYDTKKIKLMTKKYDIKNYTSL